MQIKQLLSGKRQRMWLAVVSVVMFLIYAFLDARGGPHTNLFGPKIFGPSMLLHKDGTALFAADMLFDALLAFANGVLVVAMVSAKAAKAGRWGLPGSLLVAGATFGCPTCTVPLAGSLGASIFSAALPLGGIEFKILALLIVAGALAVLDRTLRRQASGACAAQPSTAVASPGMSRG